MGISLREIIFQIGGGLPDGRRFKAVQTGGPSGGCIPEQHLDLPVDYESLASVGSIMGSGGMIVIDDTQNMVDVARYFMDFCLCESCGKCVPCRVGTHMMEELLARFCRREGTERDLATLRYLCDMVRRTSLCGLGQRSEPGAQHLAVFRAGVSCVVVGGGAPGISVGCGRRMNGKECVGMKGISLQPAQSFTLKIDGRDVTATLGQSILQVATDHGISIPTLCYLEGLSVWGGCRLCVVEIEGQAKLAASCATAAAEGMSVVTQSESLSRAIAGPSWRCCSRNAITSAPCA